MHHHKSGGGTMHPHPTRDSNGNNNSNVRRPMPATYNQPFPTSSSATGVVQQPSHSFLSGSMGIANVGLAMNMNDMQNSIRSFAPPPVTDATATPFWRPNVTMVDVQQANYTKPTTTTGLDIEFNDFLTTTTAATARENGASGDAHDVTMGDVTSNLQAFPSLASLSAPSSVAPLSLVHGVGGVQARQLGPPSSTSTSPTSDASSTRSATASRPAAPVTAATGSATAADYSRYVDSTEEPDLSQHKIEQKNEKCQYHNCPNRARVSQAYGKFCNRHVIVAPCGFPGCRDKALLHSSMCDKHLAEGKDALHRILANRAQNVPVCRTFGCFKNDQGRGYCRGHEKLLMATGRLPKHINKRRLNSAYTMCSYPNCNKHSQRNHLCRTHGNMILKQAEEIVKQSTTGETFEDVLARLQKEIRRCTHPTCTKNSQRDRLCTMHYYEKHNMQRDGSGRDNDSQLSSTDGGGESDLETAVCTVDGCNLHAFSKKGLCKFHSGELTGETKKTPYEGPPSRTRPLCSISGCGKVAPYASGLCAHHGNKTNQAIQITRMHPQSPAGASASSGTGVCGSQSCTAAAAQDSSFCEYHTTQRRLQSATEATTRPSLAETTTYATQSSSTFSSDPAGVLGGFDGFGSVSSGTTGRMANLSVSTNSLLAESDARQALVNLNTSARQNTAGNDQDERNSGAFMTPSSCSNPMCTRDSFGRDYCDSCANIFSPLVVSVGDGVNNNAGAYQFPSLTATSNNQSIQPEPEGDEMWDDASEAKSRSTDFCRVNECSEPVARFGLCSEHVRLFQSGSLSVDEITLRSRQMREEKERAAMAAAMAAAEMKQPSSPKIKKYFCKADGCDKQAQKRGLCKRHFRIHETSGGDKSLGPSSFEESNQAPMAQQSCRFPGCGETVHSSTPLCPSHSRATFCWQAGCETLVESPQFCDYHAYRRECAVEGCAFTASGDSSGCATHAMERRCSHEHCEHFAVQRSDRCRIHIDDCTQQPCSLCEIYGTNNRSVYGFRGVQGKSSYNQAPGGGGDNNSDFANDRELARRSVFGDNRLM